MGCCGSDSDSSDPSPILQPLNPSNFPALLCKDILISILEHLPIDDLARAACVSRFWNQVGSNKDIQVRAFMKPWKLKQVVGKPSSGGFWREVRLAKFAILHRLGNGDSVASLAVNYSVQLHFSFSYLQCSSGLLLSLDYKISSKSDWSHLCSGISLLLFYFMLCSIRYDLLEMDVIISMKGSSITEQLIPKKHFLIREYRISTSSSVSVADDR